MNQKGAEGRLGYWRSIDGSVLYASVSHFSLYTQPSQSVTKVLGLVNGSITETWKGFNKEPQKMITELRNDTSNKRLGNIHYLTWS